MNKSIASLIEVNKFITYNKHTVILRSRLPFWGVAIIWCLLVLTIYWSWHLFHDVSSIFDALPAFIVIGVFLYFAITNSLEYLTIFDMLAGTALYKIRFLGMPVISHMLPLNGVKLYDELKVRTSYSDYGSTRRVTNRLCLIDTAGKKHYTAFFNDGSQVRS